MSFISVRHLTKTFTFYKKGEGVIGSFRALLHREILKKEAVKNISFSIDRGEFVGFVGPNGAGKTTTLKMLTGILTPTSGHAEVMGYCPWKRKDAYKKRMAIVMGQKSQLMWLLPPLETFRLFQTIYEIPEEQYQGRLEEFTELLDVRDVLRVQVRKLSLGQRMKCEMISALLHGPDVLFLDEPTIGLDVVSQKKIRSFLKRYNKERKCTIILTSHNMDDVQDLCQRLIMIDHGKIGYDGDLATLFEYYNHEKVIRVQFEKRVTRRDLIGFGHVIMKSGYEAELHIPSDRATDVVAGLLKKLPVKDIGISGATLEEIVMDMFGETLV